MAKFIQIDGIIINTDEISSVSRSPGYVGSPSKIIFNMKNGNVITASGSFKSLMGALGAVYV